MKKKWSTLFYIIIVSGLGAVIYWIIRQGDTLQNPVLTTKQLETEKLGAGTNSFQVFTDSFNHNLAEPIAINWLIPKKKETKIAMNEAAEDRSSL